MCIPRSGRPRRAAPTIAPNGLLVCSDDLPQRPPVVLDSVGNGEDAFATARRDAGSVEYLHALFSGLAARGIFIRTRYNLTAGRSQAGGSARRDPAALLSLLAASVRWEYWFDIRNKQSGAVALRLPDRCDWVAGLSYFNHQPVTSEVVYTRFSKRSLLPFCGK